MAGSINKVILIGTVGHDPEVREVGGKKIAIIRLATNETWRDKASGEKKQRTEWHRVVVYNEGLVKLVGNYVTKGAKLYIEGQLHTRKWTDNSGHEKSALEIAIQYGGNITMLSSFPKRESEQAKEPPKDYNRGIDDPIPF